MQILIAPKASFFQQNAPTLLAAEASPQTPLVRSLQRSIDCLRGGAEIFFKPQLPGYTSSQVKGTKNFLLN